MNADRFLWWLMPGLVLVSGNFSPFRLGPILPIFGLLIIYVITKYRQLSKFFQRNSILVLVLALFIIGAILMMLYVAVNQQLQGNEFEGAIHPILYSLMSLCRYLLVVMVLIILTHKDALKYRGWWRALLASYCVILLPLYAQAFLHIFFNFDFGYLFPVENGMRYGGLIGEPQTISAWLCSFFLVLYLGADDRVASLAKFMLIVSIFTVLILTQSTAWILGLFVFVFFQIKIRIALLILVVVMIVGVFDSISDKILADIFLVSERTVTILAGAELFMSSYLNILLGYGVGLTPYLINNTDVFSGYPEFNLSHLGRQTVMNSYLEVFFELGLIGGLLYFYLLIKASNITTLRQVLIISPILVGIFGVSGGLSSGYFLISVPLLLRLSRQKQLTA